MRWLLLAVVGAVLAYALNVWVTGHALAVAFGGRYAIDGEGWQGLKWILLAGFVPGAIIGMLTSSKIGEALGSWVDGRLDEQRKALADERHKIEAAKSAMDGEIAKAAAEGRWHGLEIAQNASEARFEAETRARALQRQQKAMQGRLKGAQQRAARFAKRQRQV